MALRTTRADAWRLLNDAKPAPWVVRHCRCVEGLALAMCDAAHAQGIEVDRDVVQQGALLHDIGRSVTQDVRHAGIGADLLRAAGWPTPVVLAVERHTGAGIDPDEAKALGLPSRDYMPRTLEQKIVAHADNLHSGDKRLDLAQLEAKYAAKGLPAAWRRIAQLHEELQGLLCVDLEALPQRQDPADPAS